MHPSSPGRPRMPSFHGLQHLRGAGETFPSLADATLKHGFGMSTTGEILDFARCNSARADAGQQRSVQLSNLADVVGLPPGLCAASDCAGGEMGGKGVGGEILSSNPV